MRLELKSNQTLLYSTGILSSMTYIQNCCINAMWLRSYEIYSFISSIAQLTRFYSFVVVCNLLFLREQKVLVVLRLSTLSLVAKWICLISGLSFTSSFSPAAHNMLLFSIDHFGHSFVSFRISDSQSVLLVRFFRSILPHCHWICSLFAALSVLIVCMCV